MARKATIIVAAIVSSIPIGLLAGIQACVAELAVHTTPTSLPAVEPLVSAGKWQGYRPGIGGFRPTGRRVAGLCPGSIQPPRAVRIGTTERLDRAAGWGGGSIAGPSRTRR